ncbi:MAG: dihydropteroate synthase, partial [bacterium]
LLAGERTNTAGSRLFRTAVKEERWEEAVQLGLAQEREGAHLLDLSAATAERHEAADLGKLASLFNQQAHLPLMLDSTDPAALEEGLRAVAGRAVINSAHLEDGGGKARQVIELACRYGAALVLLTIDKEGMAQTCQRKLEVAERLYQMALEGGLEPQDLFFDPLTFTLASGDTSLCAAGRETLAALPILKERFPQSFTSLGISNISYGLPAPARRLLNSVFLARAVERGLDAAILHAGQILPLHRLAAEEVRLADDLLFDRRSPGNGPLSALLTYFREGAGAAGTDFGDRIQSDSLASSSLGPAARLRRAVLEGDGHDLAELLEGLLTRCSAITIIEEHLSPAMEEVGRLFERGELLLPFVLRSAEVMRRALALLQSYLPAGGIGRSEGCVVLATVRGDVHDIGKNLVGMILAGYGFQVIDLGTRQSAEAILEAVRQYQPLAVGLSSLLIESARSCRAYLEIFQRAGVSLPVLLGGAAMTRSLAEGELQALYPGPVRYAADAMEGLRILQQIQRSDNLSNPKSATQHQQSDNLFNPKSAIQNQQSKINLAAVKIPRSRDLFTPPLEEFLPFLDRRTLFHQRWQWVSSTGGGGSQAEEAQQERASRALARLLSRGKEGGLWEARVLSHAYPVWVEGTTLTILHPRSGKDWL